MISRPDCLPLSSHNTCLCHSALRSIWSIRLLGLSGISVCDPPPPADTLSRTPPLITPPTPDSVFSSAHRLCSLWRQRHHVHPDFTETRTDKDCLTSVPSENGVIYVWNKMKNADRRHQTLFRLFCDLFPESSTRVEAINHQASFNSAQSPSHQLHT